MALLEDFQEDFPLLVDVCNMCSLNKFRSLATDFPIHRQFALSVCVVIVLLLLNDKQV